MYRDKSKPPRTPQDTQFWKCAAKLKKDKFKTIVHALAWHSLPAYTYLLNLLETKTPLERITILLWRDHYRVVRKLEQLGYGSFSPSSIRTFREKYFRTNDSPQPQKEKLKIEHQITYLQAKRQYIESLLKEVEPIEKRVSLTNIGQKMRFEVHEILSQMIKLQTRLS